MAKNLEITLPADRGILRRCDVAQRVSSAVVESNAILILDLSCNRRDMCCRITLELVGMKRLASTATWWQVRPTGM